MDLLNISQKISKQEGILPSRTKGQNFLISGEVYDSIVDFAQINSRDTVLEVGPGLGFLTEKLSKKAKKVIAVELDDRIYNFLSKKFKGFANVELINSDILNLRVSSFKPQTYKIVANLPYNITSRFLRVFLENEAIRPEMMVLMLQKEVAERIVAKPGKMSLLALSVQLFAEPVIALNVPKKYFWPEPRVDSAVIKIIAKKDLQNLDYKKFFQMLKFGFSAKRKMLKKNLAAGYRVKPEEIANNLNNIGIKDTARAQDLSLEEWVKMHCSLANSKQ